MSQKTKEMPVYDRPSSFYSTKTNEVEAPGEAGIQDLRLQTDGQRRDGISDFGRTAHPNKPNRFKFWWVNQIDGFRPEQTQAIYLPCCELDTAKVGLFFLKEWMVTTDQGLGERRPRYDEG